MSSQLHSQLELEKTIFNNLLEEGRDDLIAKIVLTSVQKNIKRLEREIHAKVRKKSDESRRTSRFIRNVLKVVHRFKNFPNRGNNTIFQIPAITVLQTQAGT